MAEDTNKRVHVVDAAGIATGGATVTVKATVRTHFTAVHLMTAARFSRAVSEIERARADTPALECYEDIRQNSIACVLTATASIEAYSNELYVDRHKELGEEAASLVDAFAGKFFSNNALSMNAISRFSLILFALRAPAIDQSGPTHQNLQSLITLRNAITHYVPEFQDEPKIDRTVSGALRGRFEPSKLIQDAGEDIFPRRWPCSSCTKWAVNSVLNFAREFERLSGLPSRYAGFEDRLTV